MIKTGRVLRNRYDTNSNSNVDLILLVLVMSFTLYKPVGNQARDKDYRLIKNSEVIKVGDALVDESTGMANVDGTGEKIAGFATAIVTAEKVSLEAPSVDTGDLGGTWTTSTKSYTAAADNQTVDGVMVEFIPVQEGDKYIATLDAAKGTTTGSDLVGYFVAILTTDSSLLDESTTSTSAASTQFRTAELYTEGLTTEVVVICTVRGTDQYTAD